MMHASSRVRAGQIGGRSLWAMRLTLGLLLGLSPGWVAAADVDMVEERYLESIQPLLEIHCYACHGYGAKKGGVSLDGFTDAASLRADPDLWWAVLKNVRAGVMPPPSEERPTVEEIDELADWIKYDAFGTDPEHPDPGRVTVRRLNRVEYRNTVRDLLGVDYDTTAEFPADDAGHGFDNIGDVLTISPLLMEKYLLAAQEIITRVVPTASGMIREEVIPGQRFRRAEAEAEPEDEGRRNRRGGGSLSLSYYESATASATFEAEYDGRYEVVVNITASERYVDGIFDLNRCRLVLKIDGEVVHDEEYTRQGGKSYSFTFDRAWEAGPHELTFELEPLTPGVEQVRSLTLRVNDVTVRGPLDDDRYLVRPENYDQFFPREAPDDAEGRRAYARELLEAFATKAFRRPVGDETLGRLVGLAERVYSSEDQTFEAGIAQAMIATLASPRFLFREEAVEPGSSDPYPLIDEYALASRLSYFFWSSMPDEELFRLAAEGKLRANLEAQVERMLADGRSEQFIRQFVGQWLQARDVESVPINTFAVITRDEVPDPEAEQRRDRFRELRRKPAEELTDAEKAELEEIRANFVRAGDRFRQFELTGELRRDMRRETEMHFERIVRENRSVLELIDSDYAYLNERLARQYGIEGVTGDEMRLVELPADSPRGGVLTQGTVLVVTSNPDRTSPVKRGLFVLENLLGTPPPPPPPDIPPLEEAGRSFGDRTPTLRETLALHRERLACASCHDRMDPLGLALENFNALGRWRDMEREVPIEPAGKLVTGEEFSGVQELKRILVEERREDFYHCLAEKLLTYALGRGLEYHDVHAVDRLVERLERSGGRANDLILGIIESAPFQRSRRGAAEAGVATTTDGPSGPALGPSNQPGS